MPIDSELTAADAEGLLEKLRTAAELRKRVGQLRLSRQRVRHAHAGISAASPACAPRTRAW